MKSSQRGLPRRDAPPRGARVFTVAPRQTPLSACLTGVRWLVVCAVVGGLGLAAHRGWSEYHRLMVRASGFDKTWNPITESFGEFFEKEKRSSKKALYALWHGASSYHDFLPLGPAATASAAAASTGATASSSNPAVEEAFAAAAGHTPASPTLRDLLTAPSRHPFRGAAEATRAKPKWRTPQGSPVGGSTGGGGSGVRGGGGGGSSGGDFGDGGGGVGGSGGGGGGVPRARVADVTLILNHWARDTLALQLEAVLGASALPRETWVCLFSVRDPARLAAYEHTVRQFTPRFAAARFAAAGAGAHASDGASSGGGSSSGGSSSNSGGESGGGGGGGGGVALHAMTSSFNFKFFGRFQMALQASTAYVWVVDDDVVPGARFLEGLMHVAGSRLVFGALGSTGWLLPPPARLAPEAGGASGVSGVYSGGGGGGGMGVGGGGGGGGAVVGSLVDYRDPSTRGGLYLPDDRYNLTVLRLTEADVLCSQWFLRTSLVGLLFKERPPTFATGEDMMLSYSLRKFAGLPSYILPVNPFNPGTWGNFDPAAHTSGNVASATQGTSTDMVREKERKNNND